MVLHTESSIYHNLFPVREEGPRRKPPGPGLRELYLIFCPRAVGPILTISETDFPKSAQEFCAPPLPFAVAHAPAADWHRRELTLRTVADGP